MFPYITEHWTPYRTRYKGFKRGYNRENYPFRQKTWKYPYSTPETKYYKTQNPYHIPRTQWQTQYQPYQNPRQEYHRQTKSRFTQRQKPWSHGKYHHTTYWPHNRNKTLETRHHRKNEYH